MGFGQLNPIDFFDNFYSGIKETIKHYELGDEDIYNLAQIKLKEYLEKYDTNLNK